MTSASQPPDAVQDIVVLPARCVTVAAEDLRNQLVMASSLGHETNVDAGAVQTVGQAVLQLLLSARNDAAAQQRGFRFSAMSPAFVERVTAMCLATPLGIATKEEDPTA